MNSHHSHEIGHRRTLFVALAMLLSAGLLEAQGAARRLQVLFFGAPTANGPHHDPITRYRRIKQVFGVDGIDFTWSDDPLEALDPARLRDFDAVLMYGNWHQNGPMPKDQLDALIEFVENGGGFLPIHCASACYGGSPRFVRLVGARFLSHGGEEFTVENVVPKHPILATTPSFRAWDETYVHADHGDDRTILQTRAGEPWTWTRTQGRGRVFYTAAGHDHRVWDRSEFQALLRNAIFWSVSENARARLRALKLPKLEEEVVSLPGYRTRAEITRAQKPLSPSDSMKLAQVPPGMRLELFASEPDIVNPIHIAFDERGRAFVIETVDYPNELQRGNVGNDRITICIDENADGRADRFVRFAEQLSIPTSLVFCNGGVICTNGTELLFLADTDGDDRADVRRRLFDGFRMGDTHAGVSNLRYGPGGWIYATIGYSGFAGEVGGQRHEFGQGVFRFRPDGSALEFLQHTTNNTWGLSFTEEFDIVGSTANGNPSWFFTFPDSVRRRFGVPTEPTPRADDNPLFFPISTDIRQVDQFDRYTAAAGHTVYTAHRLPAAYHDRIAFVCEPTGKLIGQFILDRVGAGFRARQSANNLYASADAWSAPVAAEIGPDGAVWICDWYNLIVQHNPTPSRASAGVDARTGRGNAYETPLRDVQHGRIYRVVPTAPATAAVNLATADPASWVRALAHVDMNVRMHAQRRLVETGARETAEELIAAVRRAGVDAPHAFDVLAQLGVLPAELTSFALTAERSALRRIAIANADPAALRAAFLRDGRLIPRGRELAFVLVGLAESAADPELGAALLALARDDRLRLFDDRVLREAWNVAARAQAAQVLAAASALEMPEPAAVPVVNLLPNPSFRTRTDAAVEQWTDLRVYSGAGRDRVQVGPAAIGRDDEASLRVATDRASDCGVAVTVRVQPDTRYRLSGYVRTEDLVPVRGSPGAMFNIHGGARTEGVVGTRDWTELAVEFDSGDRTEVIVHCLFGGYGGARGNAWFDDVALTPLGRGGDLNTVLAELRAYSPIARGTSDVASRSFPIDDAVHARGAAVYGRTCIACHGIDGRGVPGAFPPLDGSDWVTSDPSVPIRIVLHGLDGKVRVGDAEFQNVMVPLGPALTDAEIADVVTYVRQKWSNDASAVDATAVRALRAAHAERKTPWTAKELGR
ncbi:MAG: PVC-type heme-binding CxxCH protein [Planctomycetota bacterium]